MKNLLKKLRHKAALYVFNHYYSTFLYSFETAEKELAALSEPGQLMYYEDISNWVKSKAYEIESKGLIKQYYAELATEAPSEDVLTAYRLLLLKEKSHDIRLRSKVDHYEKLKIERRYNNSLDKPYAR